MDGATSIVAGLAELKGLDLSSSLEADVPTKLVGDEDRLRQILLNLLNNAVKFTAAGTVALRTKGRIEADGSMRLRFSVTDSGIGVPLEKRDRLFQRFSQADDAIGRNYGGTGLGLAISKSLVELMGGAIGIESPWRRRALCSGSRSRFPSMLDQLSAISIHQLNPPAAQHARSSWWTTWTSTGTSAAPSWKRSGTGVDVVSGGVDAVQAVQEKAYDLVLMDVQMPDLDGLAATRIIRALAAPARDVPIVAMTANVLPTQVAEILQSGMNAHVGKPFRHDDLHAVIGRWALNRVIVPSKIVDADVQDISVEKELVALIGAESFDRLLAKLRSAIDEHLCDDRLHGNNATRLAADAHAMISIAGMLGFMGLSQACSRLADSCGNGAAREGRRRTRQGFTRGGSARNHLSTCRWCLSIFRASSTKSTISAPILNYRSI